jgi:hypothetical protein
VSFSETTNYGRVLLLSPSDILNTCCTGKQRLYNQYLSRSGLSNARISAPYCQIRDTLELTHRLADCLSTRNSLPPLLYFGNCDLFEPSANHSGIRSSTVRVSVPIAVLESSSSPNSRSMRSKKTISGPETGYSHSCMWKEAKGRNLSTPALDLYHLRQFYTTFGLDAAC